MEIQPVDGGEGHSGRAPEGTDTAGLHIHHGDAVAEVSHEELAPVVGEGDAVGVLESLQKFGDGLRIACDPIDGGCFRVGDVYVAARADYEVVQGVSAR